MAKQNNIILWIIGIIILLMVLNYFNIIDLSQIFSISKKRMSTSSIGMGGGG